MKSEEVIVPQHLREFLLEGTPRDVACRYARLKECADETDFGWLDEDIVVVDTETTGVSYKHDELTQIAAARMEKGVITDRYTTFVNPGKHIPDEVSHLTNIHDEDVAEAPDPNTALEGLAAFVGAGKLVAHNAYFDRTFVTRHEGGARLAQNHWFDTLDLARIVLPRLKSHRLIDIVRAFDAPLSTHRADADVTATCAVYRILLAGVLAMPHDLVVAISQLAPSDEWSTQPVFSHIASMGEHGGGGFSDSHAAKTKGVHNEKVGFSLYAMRKRRVAALPKAMPKRDARSAADDFDHPLVFPEAADIEQAFGPEGLLSRIYRDYEPRPEQTAMALAVGRAFAKGENLVVEAGTGVGKSMAYLVPSALLAYENDIAVGIATKTNALLDQLVYGELPALAKAFSDERPGERPLAYAAIKGYSHYLCLHKVAKLVEDGARVKDVSGTLESQACAIAAVLSYAEQSDFDDTDGLKIDYRLVPRYLITTTSRECLKTKCPFFGSLCYVRGARRRAESADIVVTNHTLLFCNLAADEGILPTARHWVVDEAHDAESEARRAFTQTVRADELMRLCGRISGENPRTNVFLKAERRVDVGEEEKTRLFYALIAKAKSAGETLSLDIDELARKMKGLLYYDADSKSRSYEHVDLWINASVRTGTRFQALAAVAIGAIGHADALIKASQELVGYLDGVDGVGDVEQETASVAMSLKSLRNALELIFVKGEEGYVYQAKLDRKKDRFDDAVEAVPLDMGAILRESFYENELSVVYASATLSVGGSFDAFETAMGLKAGEGTDVDTLMLESCFDFDDNMVVYVVKDMPEPNDVGYLKALERLLVEAHLAQGGSMLTLFTNRREMETCFEAVYPELKKSDLRLVCQKWGVSVKGLRDDFLKDEHLSLFALKSFWQGFDAPGATLRGVIVAKLPFARPSDPLYRARSERDRQAWMHYVLPQAVIETKQAAGRLIRKADDSGVLILADKRLLTKGYGKTFLRSMPSKTVRVSTIEEIARSLGTMNRR